MKSLNIVLVFTLLGIFSCDRSDIEHSNQRELITSDEEAAEALGIGIEYVLPTCECLYEAGKEILATDCIKRGDVSGAVWSFCQKKIASAAADTSPGSGGAGGGGAAVPEPDPNAHPAQDEGEVCPFSPSVAACGPSDLADTVRDQCADVINRRYPNLSVGEMDACITLCQKLTNSAAGSCEQYGQEDMDN